jgi:hypothetical protein
MHDLDPFWSKLFQKKNLNSFENKLEQKGKTKCPGGFFKNPFGFQKRAKWGSETGTGRRSFWLLGVLF